MVGLECNEMIFKIGLLLKMCLTKHRNHKMNRKCQPQYIAVALNRNEQLVTAISQAYLQLKTLDIPNISVILYALKML